MSKNSPYAIPTANTERSVGCKNSDLMSKVSQNLLTKYILRRTITALQKKLLIGAPQSPIDGIPIRIYAAIPLAINPAKVE